MNLMEDSSLQLVAAAFLLFFTWILLDFCIKNRDLAPGPWGIPFFGYYLSISSKPHLDFNRLSKKYGDIFSFRTAGGKLFVVLNGAKLIKEILVERADEFIGKPVESNLVEWISDGLGLQQEEGSTWKEHRRYYLHTVKKFGFGKLEIEGTINEQIKVLKDDLMKTDGKPIDMSFHISYALNCIITQIMFARKFEKYGETFPNLSKSIHDLVDTFADHRFMLLGYPFQLAMRFLPWSGTVHQGRLILKNTIQNIIDDHIRTFDPNNIRDYVDSFLYQRELLKKSGELEKSSFTMERLLAISMNMTMEATASFTINKLLLEASKHPEEQKKVQEEIDSVIGAERLPSCADRPSLPYLDAFIQELFRTAQTFLFTSHYSNFKETTIHGYRIPQRSVIIGNLWTINHDPALYPNPSVFDVNRFLDKNEKKIKTEGPYPFSVGKRDCIGQSLAQMEIFLIIASLLQNFSLQPGDKEGNLRIVPRK